MGVDKKWKCQVAGRLFFGFCNSATTVHFHLLGFHFRRTFRRNLDKYWLAKMKLLAWVWGIFWIKIFKGSAWGSNSWAQSFNQVFFCLMGSQTGSSGFQLVVK